MTILIIYCLYHTFNML